MANTIGMACDHAGYALKEELKKSLEAMGYEVKDYGAYSDESVDYPDFAHALAEEVEKGTLNRGIAICGSGNGISMSANKHPHVRAALCWMPEIAKLAREHNDANILSLPARFIPIEQAKEIMQIFLSTPFEGGRHERRVKKIEL
ncbi:MAG: ribose 5-phosphate isomerase B [Porphyromonas sp.]|nr:ribose 5-phosphate isomerase B [Porphyromonas sp.]